MSVREKIHESYQKFFKKTECDMIKASARGYSLDIETYDLLDKLMIFIFSEANKLHKKENQVMIFLRVTFFITKRTKKYIPIINEINYQYYATDYSNMETNSQSIDESCWALEDFLWGLFELSMYNASDDNRKNVTRNDVYSAIKQYLLFSDFDDAKIILPKIDNEIIHQKFEVKELPMKLLSGKIIIDI
jgi:hypothetical protein